jgi:membrane-associated phospholipid phosphatase
MAAATMGSSKILPQLLIDRLVVRMIEPQVTAAHHLEERGGGLGLHREIPDLVHDEHRGPGEEPHDVHKWAPVRVPHRSKPRCSSAAKEPSVLPDREGRWGEFDDLRSRRLCGGRRHDNAHVGPCPSPALPGHSRSWRATAAVLATVGGARDRRAAINGVASHRGHLGGCQPAAQAARPPAPAHRVTHHVPITRHMTMPRTASFPSGHAASASAFATGVATAWPEAGLPLSAAATLVGYSGVHPGVHYPVDVIAGSLTGTTLAPLTAAALGRRRGRGASGLNATCHDAPRRTGRSGSAAGTGVSPWPCLCAPLSSSRISPHRRTVVPARDGLASDDRPWSQPSNVSSPGRRRTASSSHDH